jgi:hypothetical protein
VERSEVGALNWEFIAIMLALLLFWAIVIYGISALT